MSNKKKIILSLFSLVLVAIIFFQISSMTSFRDVLNQNISDKDKISQIFISADVDNTGNTLWTRIDEPKLIEQLINELSDISIKRQFTKNNRILNHTMTIHTQSNSYFFDFDKEHFVGNAKDYKIVNGSFVNVIRSLGNDVEWKTLDEFLEVN